MAKYLPTVKITVDDVIRFSQKNAQNPSSQEATEWLKAHRLSLNKELKEILSEKLDDLLHNACLDG